MPSLEGRGKRRRLEVHGLVAHVHVCNLEPTSVRDDPSLDLFALTHASKQPDRGTSFAQRGCIMRLRLIVAHAFGVAVLLPLLAGCSAAHERGEPGPADASFVDSGASPDSSLGRDSGTRPDPAIDGGICSPGAHAVAVRIEPVTSEVDRCRVTHVDDMAIYAVEPAPDDDGIRIRADFCPGADADCRCDLVVANVGTDVAPSVLPTAGLTLDVMPGSGFVGSGIFVSIQEAPRCRCDGCACSLALVLYAADTTPETAPHVPPEVSFARGGEVCPEGEPLGAGTWNVAVVLPSGAVDVPAGTERAFGAIRVRGIRDVDVFAPFAACAGCATPHGSWIAWAED